jgi:chromosome segregation ATPase
MRKILTACMLSLIGSPALCQPTDGQLQPLQQEIRIPSITSRWKRPDDKDSPEITIEEIERCIGQDVNMQNEVRNVKQQQLQLEPERAALDKGNGELKLSATAIETNRTSLQEQIDKIQSESANLSSQLSIIEKKKNATPKSQAEVKAINALVASYNADVARHNKRREYLIKDQQSFNASVEKHNAAVAELSQRVVVFNKHNDDFQDMAAALTKKSEQYVSSCAGERLLKK